MKNETMNRKQETDKDRSRKYLLLRRQLDVSMHASVDSICVDII